MCVLCFKLQLVSGALSITEKVSTESELIIGLARLTQEKWCDNQFCPITLPENKTAQKSAHVPVLWEALGCYT